MRSRALLVAFTQSEIAARLRIPPGTVKTRLNGIVRSEGLGTVNPHDGFIEHRVEYATPILDETDLATFEAHLVHCEDCRREVSGSRRTWLRGSGLHWRVRSLAVILLTSHPLSGP